MTHNYNYDLAMTLIRKKRCLVRAGPRQKLDRMLDEMKREGITLTVIWPELATSLGPPVSKLAQKHPEIWISLSRIKATLAKKKGRSLRENENAIHSRSETRVEKVHLVR